MSATDKIGFVRVEGNLEPADIASEIAANIHRRIGEFVVLSAEWLDEEDRPLNQIQKVHIAGTASRIFDGIERDVLDVIVTAVMSVEKAS